jgi:hypothetical protein
MTAARNFRALDDLVLQLKGLVLVRELLQGRGATDDEIDAHSAEIERVGMHLVAFVRST